MAPLKTALLLHLLIETPASLSFLLAPQAQLPGASAEARLILRNLGGLLVSTNLVALVLLTRPLAPETEQLTALLCLCLGTYHVWPIYRAWARMGSSSLSDGKAGAARKDGKKVLGGPAVHFVVHMVCLAALFGAGTVGVLEG